MVYVHPIGHCIQLLPDSTREKYVFVVGLTKVTDWGQTNEVVNFGIQPSVIQCESWKHLRRALRVANVINFVKCRALLQNLIYHGFEIVLSKLEKTIVIILCFIEYRIKSHVLFTIRRPPIIANPHIVTRIHQLIHQRFLSLHHEKYSIAKNTVLDKNGALISILVRDASGRTWPRGFLKHSIEPQNIPVLCRHIISPNF